jgi:enamine deaminase RidA (YjgF/YER057c/UK114 family)
LRIFTLVIERHHGGGAFEAVAAYCRAVRSGPLVAVSGTAATDERGAALHPGDVYAQTRVSFEQALRGLAAFGGGAT